MRFVHCQFELVHMCVVAVRRRQQVCEYIEIQVLFERYVSPYIYVDLLAQQIMKILSLSAKWTHSSTFFGYSYFQFRFELFIALD